MMGDGACSFVHRIGPEISDVILDRGERFLRRDRRAGPYSLDVGCDLHRHLTVRAVIDHPLGIGAAIPIAAIDARADIAPGAEQLLCHLAAGHAAPARASKWAITMSPKCTGSR